MNNNIYRLVFNAERGAWLAVAETVRGRGKQSSRRRLAVAVLGLAASGTAFALALVNPLPASAAPAARPLVATVPVPSTAASRPFVLTGTVTGGQPTTTTNASGGRDMSIATSSRALGLNWDSFNLGAASSVTFRQPDASSRVLNRIWSADPSVILGRLSANGQVYLVNQNGILFGNGAQVNVGGLVASALNLSDSMAAKLLNNGLPTVRGDRLEFAWDGSAAGFNDGFVTVEAGAGITTPSGGRVVLIAPKTVENVGLIEGGAGAEAILAAGGKVILTAPDDPALSGLLIETRSWKGVDAQGIAVTLDGSVTNAAGSAPAGGKDSSSSASGAVGDRTDTSGSGTAASSPGQIRLGSKGVISLAALAVNQQGIVNASRAVNINGSTLLVSGSTTSGQLNLRLRDAAADISLANGSTETAATAAVQAPSINLFQGSQQAAINWSGGFNLRSDQTLSFLQPGTGSIAYNYIYDESRSGNLAARSIIDGTLKANGQLFLINQKGFDFRANANPTAFGGKLFHADVKAANVIVSALSMNPDVVSNGLFNQDGMSARTFYLTKAQLIAKDTPLLDDEGKAKAQATIDKERATNLAAASALGMAAFAAASVKLAPGAQIGTTVDNGFAMLVGASIDQGGTITTAKGQTLLAAGADVYLKPPYAAGLRGFSVETNPLYVVQGWATADGRQDFWNVVTHGSIVNRGRISAPLGNITLAAFDLTQAGILSSSTSVTANGSIRLLARDQVAPSGLASTETGELALPGMARDLDAEGVKPYAGEASSASQSSFVTGMAGGAIKLAQGSTTQIVLDNSSGKTIAPDQIFISSSIEATAAKITIEGAGQGRPGAALMAKGGRIQFLSSEQFDATNGFIGDPILVPQTAKPAAGVGIFVGDGATLDVSGAVAEKSVADLFIDVELRGDEFANNPVQRNSVLRGKTARVDIRDKVAIAELGGWTGKVGQTLAEKAATGGSIALRSTGSVVVKATAKLDVSGGRVNYAAGKISESHAMTAAGKLYRLNDAPTTATYTDLIPVSREEPAYTEGKSAGTVQLVGNSLAVDGKLSASTVRGARQRNLGDPASDRYAIPLGGQLIVKDAGQHFADAALKPQLAFVRDAARAAAGLVATGTGPARTELSQSLVDRGFSRFDLQSDGRIDIPAGVALNLGPGGSFRATGWQVNVAGQITAPGGTIALATGARDVADASYVYGNVDNTLVIDSGARLSVAGTWLNDYLDGIAATTAKSTQGGAIRLSSLYDVNIRSGSLLDVSGGALLDSKGVLTAGNAGSVTLVTGGMTKPKVEAEKLAIDDDFRRDASLFLDGTLAAYALGKGGSLEVDSSQIVIGKRFDSKTVAAKSRTARLAAGQFGAGFTADFFNQGGFYKFTLIGRDGVTVNPGVRVVPKPTSWFLPEKGKDSYPATGTAIDTFAQRLVLHPDRRIAPTSLTLGTRSLNFGALTIGDNAYLGVSAQGSIALESWGQLSVLGTLDAPAGSIRLSRPANSNEDSYNLIPITYSERRQSESIFLGPNSRLLAAGTTVLDPATRAALDAGAAAETLRNLYRYKGQVLAGGSVDLSAGLGYVITAADAKTGSRSLIDVSGAQDVLNAAAGTDNGGVSYPLQTVGSGGGSVSLSAREGMLLDGGYAAGGSNGAPGGSFSARLELQLNGGWDGDGLPAAISAARQLTLFQSSGRHPAQWTLDATATAGYLAGFVALAPAQYNGKARLDLANLVSGGFGSWYLGSQDEIRFDGLIGASVKNQLRLDAPRYYANSSTSSINLAAAAIQIGNFQASAASAASAVAATDTKSGAPAARFTARDIGISGNFAWNGFATSSFSSHGEIHFDSTPNTVPNRAGGRNFSGQMTAAGTLEFAAARLSPSTWSDYRINLAGDPASRISIRQLAGASAGPSLSAGGRLEFSAQTIDQNGTVIAPLGEIVFTAPHQAGDTGSVTLGTASMTSVAADQTMMLGQTDQSGRLWQFKASYWNPTSRTENTATYAVTQAPEKAIRIDAANTAVKTGAKLDLSAGGEAQAWEFSPGPGGKKDILDVSSLSAPNVFAVIKGWSGGFAPQDADAMAYYDATAQSGSTYSPVPYLKAGDAVRIGDGSGLGAGIYTLLPARYALLPDAHLLTVKATQDTVVGRAKAQADGSTLVSGSRLALNADGSTSAYSQRPLTLEIASPEVARKRASYLITSASDFFAGSSGTKLPGDAGLLSVAGRKTLAYDPTVSATRLDSIAAADGRRRPGLGLALDLAAPKLFITDAGSAADATWTSLDQGKLNALETSSLLLGGIRTTSAGEATSIETISAKVTVSNQGATDATRALSGTEILLSASDTLTVTAGSRISDRGGATASGGAVLLQNGDGAFMRVAHGEQTTLSRNGTVTRSRGDLLIDDGARISGRALSFDATHSTALSQLIDVGTQGRDGSWSGGAIAIGAGRINVVGDGSLAPDGLTISNASLAGFARADQVQLTSYTTLDLYGNVELGTTNLKELTISAAGIAGHGDADDLALIKAQTLRLANLSPASSSFASPNLGKGRLQVDAKDIVVAANASQAMRTAQTAGFAVRGFGAVELKAAEELRFEGVGVTAIESGNTAPVSVTLDAGRIAAAAASNQLLQAGGATRIQGGGGAANRAASIGGTLEIRGASLAVAGLIDMPAGKLTLQATDGKLSVENGALIKADGVAVPYADTFAFAPAGEILLTAAAGDIGIDAGAAVSVSAVTGGDAGKLSLLASKGTVSAAAGTLRGSGDAGDESLKQASLVVDARSVDLTALSNAVLEQASVTGGTTRRRHFAGQWDVRRRVGDLALTADHTIQSALITLAADAGSVDIGGTLDASGKSGGEIGLHAKSATDIAGNTTGGVVTLQSGGKLLANATEYLATASGTRGRGGKVGIGVDGSGALIELKQDSLIDVSVASSLTRDANGNSVKVASAAPPGQVNLRAPRVLDRVASTATTKDSTAYELTVGAAQHSGSALVFSGSRANIGSTALNINGGGELTLKTVGGGSLADNAIPGNTTVTTVSDGSNYWVAKIGTTSYLPTSAPSAIPGSSTSTLANTYAISSGTATPYFRGQVSYFSPSRGSIATSLKGPVKLNIRNQGAVALVKNDGSGFVNANELVSGTKYYAIYDGSQFVLFASGTPASMAWYGASTPSSTTTAATHSTNFDLANKAYTNYVTGMALRFTAGTASEGTTTLSLNGLGAKALVKNDGQAVSTGDILPGQVVTAIYDGTSFLATTVAAGSLTSPSYPTQVAIAPIAGTVLGTSALAPMTIDAFRTYSVGGATTIDAKRLALWQADNAVYMGQYQTMTTALQGGRKDLAISLRPGIELRASGDITVGAAMNFGAIAGSGLIPNVWRYGANAVPGYLALRAGGNLNVSAAISDGFTPSNTVSGTNVPTYLGTDRDGRPVYGGESWTYRLVAGADLAAANPLSVQPTAGTAGSLTVSAPLIRTGTGSIDLAAQGAITLADGAAVYTAGIADTVVANKFGTDLNSIFAPTYFAPVGGGSIPQPEFGIPYDTGDKAAAGTRAFYPLGGGDLRISAGGSIVETTHDKITDWLVRYGTTYNDTQWYPRMASFRNGFAVFGGGNLSLSAGADIGNVMAVVPTNGRIPGIDGQPRADLARIGGGGNLDVAAGGSVFGGSFYAESGELRVAAGKSIASSAPAGTPVGQIPSSFTRIGLGDTQAHLVAGGDMGIYSVFNPLSTAPSYKDSSGKPIAFTWGPAGSTAYLGRIGTYTDQTAIDMLAVNGAISLPNLGLGQSTITGERQGDGLAPSRVKAAALNADFGSISGGIFQVPGSQGQLDLLAAKGLQLAGIIQYDTPADQLPSMANPNRLGIFPFSLTIPFMAHASTPWHANDPEPSRLVALNGNITGPGSNDIVTQFNESVRIQASGDIKGGLNVITQHSTAQDVTRIEAGGDIQFLTGLAAKTTFQVGGPGRLEVIAGGSVDLGSGKGIVTRGNLDNNYLPGTGADIFVMAGATAPDYARFLKYLKDQNLGVGSDASEAGLRGRFYTLLRDAGRLAQQDGGSYDAGRALIRALFPRAAPGNIDLFYSAIKTEQGGNVDLLAPGGGITVGIATPNKDLLALKKPSEQGLFTIRGGDLRAYVRNSFLVNQSRVFTLDGGDILVWADQGSIDAGNGAKTVSATPPPVLVVRGGQIILDASNSVSGSGIGVLASRDNTTASNMDLFAPQGVIDAGDAGLRSTGNITLGARTVLNAANIQAAGTVTGAPAPVSAPAPAAPAAAPANSDKGESQAAASALGNREARQGILTVEVLGGEDDLQAKNTKKDEDS